MRCTEGLGPCLPGFEGINRFNDRKTGDVVAKIGPGEFYVTTANERIETTLGSCIAACVRDPGVGVGGMNHFLLPANEARVADGALENVRYGNYAMEALINAILKNGGRRSRLEVKLFGGARMIDGLSDIGAQNAEFIRNYLEAEGLELVSEDLGDSHARIVHYWPLSGRARLKRLNGAKKVVAEEQQFQASLSPTNTEGSVELF